MAAGAAGVLLLRGILLGQLAARSVPEASRTELAAYLRQYAAVWGETTDRTASLLRAAGVYLRYPPLVTVLAAPGGADPAGSGGGGIFSFLFCGLLRCCAGAQRRFTGLGGLRRAVPDRAAVQHLPGHAGRGRGTAGEAGRLRGAAASGYGAGADAGTEAGAVGTGNIIMRGVEDLGGSYCGIRQLSGAGEARLRQHRQLLFAGS